MRIFLAQIEVKCKIAEKNIFDKNIVDKGLFFCYNEDAGVHEITNIN